MNILECFVISLIELSLSLFLFRPIETLSAVGSEVLKKYPDLGSLKVVFLPQVRCYKPGIEKLCAVGHSPNINIIFTLNRSGF